MPYPTRWVKSTAIDGGPTALATRDSRAETLRFNKFNHIGLQDQANERPNGVMPQFLKNIHILFINNVIKPSI